MISGCTAGQLILWSVTTGEIIKDFEIPRSKIIQISLSHSNKKLAVLIGVLGKKNQQIQIFEVPKDITKFKNEALVKSPESNLCNEETPTSFVWNYTDETIIVG